MLVVVTIVSLCANIYSIEYMNADPHNVRFFAYLSLFTFFMLVLICSDNLLQLFVGWEGVGLSSYLLINFWYTRIQANKSSILAVITNKIGDIALLVSAAMLCNACGSVDFAVMNTLCELNITVSNITDNAINSMVNALDVYSLSECNSLLEGNNNNNEVIKSINYLEE